VLRERQKLCSFPQRVRAEVVSNRYVKANCYKLVLKPEFPFSNAEPGQFIHIRVKDDFSPLLRRPFSISGARSEGIEIIYKVVGKGTKILSEVKKGDRLDILGPCGKGFSILEGAEKHLLIGGGIGCAPLVFLTHKITEKVKNKTSILVFLGFKKAEDIICQEEFKGKNIILHIATEDGSYGYNGLVSSLVEDYLRKLPSLSRLKIYACGPREMLKTVARLSFDYSIPSEVLMEEIIGCGVGACRGCVVRGTTGYLRVCQEGPVFDVKDILWT